MKHLGDIKRLHGANVPPVDVVIGGSPCQDLSIAGKRAGLSGERSSLFMEQIRLIKEMREVTNGEKPRYMVWENVPGAFSSNKGQDFAAVLAETVKIVEPEAPPVSVPAKGWPTSGRLTDVDGKWSVAWRVLDAQFWGVPQRRRRIALVADFGGLAAPEILFERKGVRWDTKTSGEAREETAGGAGSGAVETSRTYCIQGNCIDRADTAGCNGKGWRDDGNAYTLNTIGRHAVLYDNHAQDSRIAGPLYVSPTVSQKFGTGGNNTPLVMATGQENQGTVVYDARGNGGGATAPTMTDDHQNRITDYTAVVCDTAQVRRLTPLECERLQGFPDGWTDIGAWADSKGKVHKESSDSARYKALGNSIAIPPWTYVLSKLCAYLPHGATMASLFDGIGGFPLIWERINGNGSCLWASEIEEFPMAVTRMRFQKGGEGNG